MTNAVRIGYENAYRLRAAKGGTMDHAKEVPEQRAKRRERLAHKDEAAPVSGDGTSS